ncbi:MAG: hypothetical protein AMXMBFR53_07940 [Gemmatimonadota bacterium]
MRTRKPPRLAVWLLRQAVPPDDLDAVLGDLMETGCSDGRGSWWYVGQSVLFVAAFGAARLVRAVRGVRRPGIRGILEDGGTVMDGWMRDLGVAVRALARRPAFASVIVITLALGIGANTAIFSVIEGTILRPLPFPDPDRLIWISDGYREWGGYGSSMSLPNFLDLREQSELVESMEVYSYASVNLADEDRPERLTALVVGPGFLRVLRAVPALGRDFTRDDNVRGAGEVVMLTHDFWVSRFGGDPTVVGRTVLLDATPYLVVGVAPSEFEFRGDPPLILPMKYEGAEWSRRSRQVNAVGRMAPGVTLERARDELRTIFARLEEEYPEANENWQVWAQPLKEIVAGTGTSLRLLGGASLLVLLIACVNVANLLLARAESRQREFAVRTALGAGRGRLLPVFVSEGLVLSLVGGLGGVGLAFLGVPALLRLYGPGLPRAGAVGLNGTVLGFALGLSLVVGMVVGVLPALRSSPSKAHEHLKEGTRAISRGGRRLRQSLVVAEIALAVVLVSGAGLLLNSLARMNRVELGLDAPERVLVARMALSSGTYVERDAIVAFYRELVDQVAAVPGVEAVGLTSRLPLNGGTNITDVFAEGDPGRVSHFVEVRTVTPAFFEAIGIELLAGRNLAYADGEEGTNVVVTRALAEQLFGSPEAAVGQALRPGGSDVSYPIVGVVSDIRDLGLSKPAPPGYYSALGPATMRGRAAVALIRTRGNAMDLLPPVRDVVRRLDPGLPLYDVEVLSDVVVRLARGTRFNLSLMGLMAVLAVVLASVGIYGVMSYAVAERTREVGVRMALGARRSEVVGMVLGSGLRLAAVGIVMGVAAALAAGRFISEQLYEVEPGDPLTHAAVAALLLGVAVLSCYLPARRASTVDPVVALRQE